jgi:hypothetical protein
MAAKRHRSTGGAGLTSGPRASPLRYLWPAMLGLVLGTASFAGYVYWTQGQARQVAERVADPAVAKPAADECAIAQAALSAIHASGDDKRWRASVRDSTMTLTARSHVINPADVPGYADDEADNLRGKVAADWRGCAGLGVFVRSLGWSAMGGDDNIPELGLGRPGVNAAGDEAKVYEAFAAPLGPNGAPVLARGPWLVTLHRDAGGAWRVTATTDLPRPGH